MNVKRYFAKDMQEAMAMIRKELGPDAVILNSKSIRKSGIAGLFAKPVLEVMVAYENKLTDAAKKPAAKQQPKPQQLPKAQQSASKPQPHSPTSALERSVAEKPQLLNKPAVQVASASAVANRYYDSAAKTSQARETLGAGIPIMAKAQPQVQPQTAGTGSTMSAAAIALDNALEKWSETAFEPLAPITKFPVPEAATLVKQPPKEKELASVQKSETFSAQKAELFKPIMTKTQQAPKLFDPTDANTLKSLDTRIVALDSLISAFSKRMQLLDRNLAYSGEVQVLVERLRECEVDPDIIESIAAETQKIAESREAHPKEVMEQILKHMLGEPTPIMPLRFARTVVLVMGPTGVGKTTTLVKLAAHFALHENLKVGLINADTFRITAQEQLKTYADILGVPLDVIYSPDDVLEALENQADRDIIFIDTPGKRPSDEKHKEEVARLVELTGSNELYLVMSASTGYGSCTEIINNYSFLPDFKIIVTKLDETPARGLLLNVCHFSGKRLSYLSTGQNVPDDIVIASAEEITASILG